MKKIKVTYLVITGIFSALMLMGAIPDIMSVPEAVDIFKHLGYPIYLLPFLGIAKTLGIIAIWVPGFPRLKEWAYAGLFFDMAGAMYSSIAVGDPADKWVFFFIGFALLFGSYICYHKKMRATTQAVIAK